MMVKHNKSPHIDGIRSLWSIALWIVLLSKVEGHGRLLEPPSRSSMWRFGFKTPPNYNDNELFCGGFTVHFQKNGGKCGLCGDAYDQSQPRPNEAGGKYANGIITKHYTVGQVIQTVVELTANHRGFFEFKLCPNNNPKRIATQQCLDKYPLIVAGTRDSKYQLPNHNPGKFVVELELPKGLTCTQCVLQWTYTAGNNWGSCEGKPDQLGCGNQETFRGCADVAIGSDIPQKTNSTDNNFSNTVKKVSTPRPRRPIRPYTASKVKPKPKPTSTSKPISFTARPRPISYGKPSTTKKYVKIHLSTARPLLASTTPKPKLWSYATPSRSRPTAAPKLTSYHIYVKPQTQWSGVKPTKSTNYSSSRPNNNNPGSSRPVSNNINQGSKRPGSNNINQGSKVKSIMKCRGVGVWKRLHGINKWCDINCERNYCPPTHCKC